MRISYVELAGEKHPICFSLSAIESICDTFGSVEEMTEAVESENLGTKVKAINSLITILMEAGRAYCKQMGEDMPAKLTCRPADLIDLTDKEVLANLFSAMKRDSEREVEARGKNTEAE